MAGVKPENSTFDGNDFAVRWAELQTHLDQALRLLNQTRARRSDVESYRQVLTHELERLERARISGELLGRLKVTHCPVCDQAVEQKQTDDHSCYLCHRDVPFAIDGTTRVEFEREQLIAERNELNELVERLTGEEQSMSRRVREIEDDLSRTESVLKPLRQASAAFIPTEFFVVDQEVGRLEERIEQLNRIRKALQLRDELSQEIDKINSELAELNAQISKIGESINLSTASDVIEDGINTYLNSLNSDGIERWKEGHVDFNLSKRSFSFYINKAKWRVKLGATLKAYFLLAYNYALLVSTGLDNFNYPGFLMVDFPINFADKTTVADQENYLINPFCNAMSNTESLQLIVAGRSFEGLDANRIELNHVWK